MEEKKAFQDYYPDVFSHCYGCGRLNDKGLQIKTRWEGEESVTTFFPESYHTAFPGFVYGGLLASLIDCHSTATAAAAMYRSEGREMDTEPSVGVSLEIRGQVKEIKGRKVVITSSVTANGEVCVTGEVVAVQMPDTMLPK